MANEFTDKQIEEMVGKSMKKPEAVNVSSTNEIKSDSTTRNILVIGCGDGGSNIASDIKAKVPNVSSIIFNTSVRGMVRTNANVTIYPPNADGSGKDRNYSKQIFKEKAYKRVLEAAEKICEEKKIDYIFVTTTADGGTGSGISPVLAKLLSNNIALHGTEETPIPVIIIGVYPPVGDDAMAQYNTISWQSDIEKTELPYMIFDNDIRGLSKVDAQEKVNASIVDVINMIGGNIFSDDAANIIDSRDIYMLLDQIGGRIFCGFTTSRLNVGQNSDDYLMSMIDAQCQMEPSMVKGIGLFVKAPKDMIARIDTSVPALRAKYGEASIQYNHIEESSDICVGVILSGCNEPIARLTMMQGRYGDIMAKQTRNETIASDMASGMDNPMFGGKKRKLSSTEDISAFDI